MSQATEVPEMMGSAEVAEALGILGQNMKDVRDLPAPVQRIRASPLWLADEIRVFAQERAERRRARERARERTAA